MKDAFDLWWGWATKPRESMLSMMGYPLSHHGAGRSARSREGQWSCASVPRKSEVQYLSRAGRRTIFCLLLIAALTIVWHVLGGLWPILYSLSGSLHISSLIWNSPCSEDSWGKAGSRLVNKRKIMLPQIRVRPATMSAMPRVVISTKNPLAGPARNIPRRSFDGYGEHACARGPKLGLVVVRQVR